MCSSCARAQQASNPFFFQRYDKCIIMRRNELKEKKSFCRTMGQQNTGSCRVRMAWFPRIIKSKKEDNNHEGRRNYVNKEKSGCRVRTKNTGYASPPSTGPLSSHRREREVVAALWSQPHALPSTLGSVWPQAFARAARVNSPTWNGQASMSPTGPPLIRRPSHQPHQSPRSGNKLARPNSAFPCGRDLI